MYDGTKDGIFLGVEDGTDVGVYVGFKEEKRDGWDDGSNVGDIEG